jgi:malto-oligosyltrehalose synthase
MSASISSIPQATMRLQLNKDFTFADAIQVVPYLASLGVSHLYASPILTARPGSMHGYDVIDPTRINPELGGEDGLRALVAALRDAGLGLIVDIVPNHMGVGAENAWWYDVLKHGQASRFAGYFDIDWEAGDGKVLAPFLGKPYGEALRDGELKLDRQDGAPVVRYFDAVYPIDPGTEDDAAGDLHDLLERQNYRLAWWGTAADEINWRRFFDINGLVALRIEEPEVFKATHATLFRLYQEGLIDGVRVDHVDGLSDPPGYCRKLRERLAALESARPDDAPSGPAYLVVEKILGAGEAMPTDWGVDGTSGYDFMDTVNALQHDSTAEPALAALWASISGRTGVFEEEEIPARQEMLTLNFNAQLEALAGSLHRIALRDLTTRDTPRAAIRRGLIALLAHFRVYRTYDAGQVRSPCDDTAFHNALTAAKAASAPALHPVLDLLDLWLGGEAPPAEDLPLYKVAGTRFQQLSAPVAAKSVEDTAFYRYGRLISRNDVGFNASILGTGAAAFHEACLGRVASFPNALLATATHDHKRGEDVRARLAVLSEIPGEWELALQRWREMNAAHRSLTDEAAFSPGDEVILYQTIIGAWPADLAPSDTAGCRAFAERVGAWQEKALREAKLRTDWATPNAAYEASAKGFLDAIFQAGSLFLVEAANFARRIGAAGVVNSLAQALLKIASPGVPDFFQGSEFWDLSLVDPDNRRPVDFRARETALRDGLDPVALAPEWHSGHVKQAVITRVLRCRQTDPELFAHGSYVPVDVEGPLSDHVVAFVRSHGARACLIVVPRLPGRLLDGDGSILISAERWNGTALRLGEASGVAGWRSVLAGPDLVVRDGLVPLGDVLGAFPVGMLVAGD